MKLQAAILIKQSAMKAEVTFASVLNSSVIMPSRWVFKAIVQSSCEEKYGGMQHQWYFKYEGHCADPNTVSDSLLFVR